MFNRATILICNLFLLNSFSFAFDITRINVSSTGEQANVGAFSTTISSSIDGRFIAYNSSADNLLEGDLNQNADIFVYDQYTKETKIVSQSSSGEQGNSGSATPAISSDGRFVVFTSIATNLVPDDTNDYADIFVHDHITSTTERVSITSNGEQGNGNSRGYTAISADGRFVAFISEANNLVEGNITGSTDIFVHDRSTGITEQISKSSTGFQGNKNSYALSISADGRFVAFSSEANNLVDGDTNGSIDIFLHDRNTGITERISVSSTGNQANRTSMNPSISASGRFIAFSSGATNLVRDDSNGTSDIFVHDRNTGITELVSVSATGEKGNNGSLAPSISADGRFITYFSSASNLVNADTNHALDIIVHDRSTGNSERVSMSSTGQEANNFSNFPKISGDGRFVFFTSYATNLVENDTNGFSDIFASENPLAEYSNNLIVNIRSTSGITQVGEYIRLRALLKNNSDKTLSNCNVRIINPRVRGQREFSFFSWPLNIANPALNKGIDLAPDEIGQIQLAVLPRVPMRKEVRFEFFCDTVYAFTIPFINTMHLTAKTGFFIPEDFVELKNGNNKMVIEIDRGNGKYWSLHVVDVVNTGIEAASVNLKIIKDIPVELFGRPRLCEPIDPATNNWSCKTPRSEQLQVELAAGETKKILIFVHAKQEIEQQFVKNRVFVEAHDQSGEIVAKTSVGVYTIN